METADVIEVIPAIDENHSGVICSFSGWGEQECQHKNSE